MNNEKDIDMKEYDSFFDEDCISGRTAADVIKVLKNRPNAKISAYELSWDIFWEAIQELSKMGEQELSEKLLVRYGKAVIDLYFDFSAPADGHNWRCDPDLPRYGYSFDAMYAYGQYLKRKGDWDSNSAFELCLADVGIRGIDRTLDRWPELLSPLKGEPYAALSAEDCVELGMIYLWGSKYLEKNEEKAFESFYCAKDSYYTDPYGYAECDNYECDMALAACYLYGIGTRKDEKLALQVLKKALGTYDGLLAEIPCKLQEVQENMDLSDRTPSLAEFYCENI